MNPRFLTPATFVLVLGSALVAGVFFAFSSFVMDALARLPAARGIAAMQSINVAVLGSGFLAALLGTAAFGSVVAAIAMASQRTPASALLVTGALLHVLGVVIVTMLANVPRNEALALLDPDASGAAAEWARYVVEWTRWNHVRTLASLAGTASFALALVVRRT